MLLSDHGAFLKASSDMTDASVVIYAGPMGYTRGNSLKFTNLMVAKSNVAVEWSPAPEDTQSQSGGGKTLSLNYLRRRLAPRAERSAA